MIRLYQKKDDQYRTEVNFKVHPGNLIILDSVWYNLGDDTLQKITLEAQKETLIKKRRTFCQTTYFYRIQPVGRSLSQ